MLEHACRLGPRRHRLQAQRSPYRSGRGEPGSRSSAATAAGVRRSSATCPRPPQRLRRLAGARLLRQRQARLRRPGRHRLLERSRPRLLRTARSDCVARSRARQAAARRRREGRALGRAAAGRRGRVSAAGPPTASCARPSFKGLREDKPADGDRSLEDAAETVEGPGRSATPPARPAHPSRPRAVAGAASPSRAWPSSTPRSPTGSCRTSPAAVSLVRCPCGSTRSASSRSTPGPGSSDAVRRVDVGEKERCWPSTTSTA